MAASVRNGLANNGGTHLPCGLQYQGWPAGALSNQRLTPAVSQTPEAGVVFKEWPDSQSGPWCVFFHGPLYLVSCVPVSVSALLVADPA
ncbi:unnamed protein product [Staurois parvus]|uniref:Uncharacterized protein n=1 Tax=Staurois parvus TaxID=386267 RepID=A0ABN9E3K1_9NEOB|nr:unnamed protein product [Staurois parvus]